MRRFSKRAFLAKVRAVAAMPGGMERVRMAADCIDVMLATRAHGRNVQASGVLSEVAWRYPWLIDHGVLFARTLAGGLR